MGGHTPASLDGPGPSPFHPLGEQFAHLFSGVTGQVIHSRRDHPCSACGRVRTAVPSQRAGGASRQWPLCSHSCSPPPPQSQPLFELRCSNNVVHVHSCADSCALLVNLLQYVMSTGDLHPPPRPPSPTEIAGQKVQVRPGHTGYQSSARPLPCHGPRAWGWGSPVLSHSLLLPCLAQLSESPASLPSCPRVETALINQRDLADALLDTERSLRELAQPSGEVGVLWGQQTQSGTHCGRLSKLASLL